MIQGRAFSAGRHQNEIRSPSQSMAAPSQAQASSSCHPAPSTSRGSRRGCAGGVSASQYRCSKSPVPNLDGQNRQSPIASDFRIADSNRSPFRNFAVSECLKRIANRAFRIAISSGKDASDSNRAFFKSLAILDLDRAISPI